MAMIDEPLLFLTAAAVVMISRPNAAATGGVELGFLINNPHPVVFVETDDGPEPLRRLEYMSCDELEAAGWTPIRSEFSN
jgi:hypothetical protein